MFKKLLSVTVLGMLAGGSLFTVGCASEKSAQTGDRPYALTGRADQDPTKNPNNYDSKGHYRPDFALGAQSR
jgi:hypothetical protein